MWKGAFSVIVEPHRLIVYSTTNDAAASDGDVVMWRVTIMSCDAAWHRVTEAELGSAGHVNTRL